MPPVDSQNGFRPRVLQVGKFYAPYRGGIETHLQLLCGELRKHTDLDVIVASGGWKSSSEAVEGVRLRRASTWANLASAPICPEMVSAIRSSRADIVHLHLPNPGAVLAYLASGHKGALICSYHSDIVRQKFLMKLLDPVQMLAFRRASAIIAASPNYIESSPVLRCLRDRCHVIPYGIPAEPFEREETEAVRAIRRQYGSNLILGVGRLVYYKGFQYAIRAMEQVPGKFLLIGEGPLRQELEGEVKARGLSNKVVFLGKVENTIPYYQAADIFVLPSIARSEAFGIVQLEAMACGKPLINTNLDSGVTFVSVNGLTGSTVEPEDSEALAHAINFLLENPELRAAYGAAAKNRVRELFSVELMTNKMMRLYAQVCGAASPQSRMNAGSHASNAAGPAGSV